MIVSKAGHLEASERLFALKVQQRSTKVGQLNLKYFQKLCATAGHMHTALLAQRCRAPLVKCSGSRVACEVDMVILQASQPSVTRGYALLRIGGGHDLETLEP